MGKFVNRINRHIGPFTKIKLHGLSDQTNFQHMLAIVKARTMCHKQLASVRQNRSHLFEKRLLALGRAMIKHRPTNYKIEFSLEFLECIVMYFMNDRQLILQALRFND